jgi:hypothetical protein
LGAFQTMNVTSGCFCFGLEHKVQMGAKKNVMTYHDGVKKYSRHGAPGKPPYNTVAKKGKWNAYALIDRDTTYDEYYPNRTDDDRICGWFICHEEAIEDPVAEVCDIVFNTFNEENGGNYRHWSYKEDGNIVNNTSNDTHLFHAMLGYVLIPRYVMGYDVEIPDHYTEEEKDEMMEKGLYVVDYETAKMDSSKWTRNGICNIHTYGDFDIGRLCYNDDEECVGFYLLAQRFPLRLFTLPLKELLLSGGSRKIGKTIILIRKKLQMNQNQMKYKNQPMRIMWRDVWQRSKQHQLKSIAYNQIFHFCWPVA